MKEPVGPQAARKPKVPDPVRFRLQLYISGATPRSAQAIANIKAISEARLHGHYDLEVIDACQQAALARDQQIVVLPTLIKHLPLPIRRMIGDLSDTDRVLLGLGLAVEEPDDTKA
jgi:circadian clock protein KaiB